MTLQTQTFSRRGGFFMPERALNFALPNQENLNSLAERKALAYDVGFDIHDLKTIQAQRAAIGEKEYRRRLDQFLDRTRFNLITNLGERFNVEISTVTYYLEN